MVLTAPPDPSGAILVLCTHNSVRSPMAQALLSQAFGPGTRIVSAGTDPQDMDFFAVAAMAEQGIDLSAHQPTGCDAATLDAHAPFGLIVALSRTALETARAIGAAHGVPVEYWDVAEPPAPGRFGGSRAQLLDAYRAIRDEIARHIRNRFDLDLYRKNNGLTGNSPGPLQPPPGCLQTKR